MHIEEYLPRVVALITHLRLPDGPSRMAQIVEQVIPDYHGRARVEVVETTVDLLLDTGHALEARNDVDVIICSGATSEFLRRQLSIAILAIRMGEYDLIRALDLARAQATKVGIVSFQHEHPELQAMSSLFTVDIRQATYSSYEGVRQQIHHLVDDGYRVVVGSSTAVETAEAAGARGVLALNADTVRRALEDALAICRSRQQSLIQQQRLNTVLRNLSDGVIAVDAEGIVQSLNPRMASLLGIAGDWARGRPINEIVPGLDIGNVHFSAEGEESHIFKIADCTLAANVSPIIENGKPDGLVITCQEANAIQRTERRIRSQVKPRQFTARYRFEQMLGQASGFRVMLDLAQRYASADATVLVHGESGTGKELLAQSIHNASPRQSGPFVAINCAAFPESLLESELFGYEEGAFTGSRKGGKAGLIENAHTGTLFLDEIGDMPVTLQTRLLRVLQEREVLRLGAAEPTPIDIRVIAATHRDLRARVRDGEFREDLYYRVNILRLVIPPLRERPEDIPMLAQFLLTKLSARTPTSTAPHVLLERLMPYLQQYSWPGNIRELENIVERAVLSANVLQDASTALELQTLFDELFEPPSIPSPQAVAPHLAQDLRSLSRAQESARVSEMVERCEGDMDEAAKRLGISRTTLWRRLREAKPR
ncbi:propionate catabolism operon regulatory protein PrpR [Pseudomonas muyukensis]|uniref:Propionate catabolism operon regulatory protein PrpR n=1 Tax=Pseudomonas muyukensis TaxID=2842357 RepID=A0ABX8M234_9PSED|nr:propionate catabolism operon regulatory protein PrpR [Pseudomonas muyukensis]QXH33203.1 propionate catabolism operon regulatory protein PrpR [Pseudomonas muyukensis]